MRNAAQTNIDITQSFFCVWMSGRFNVRWMIWSWYVLGLCSAKCPLFWWKGTIVLAINYETLPFAWFEQFQQSISWNGAELVFFVIKLSQEGRRDFHYQCCSFYVIYIPGKGWSAYDCRNCATEKRSMTFGSNILVKCFNCLLRFMKQTFDSLLVLLYKKMMNESCWGTKCWFLRCSGFKEILIIKTRDLIGVFWHMPMANCTCFWNVGTLVVDYWSAKSFTWSCFFRQQKWIPIFFGEFTKKIVQICQTVISHRQMQLPK